MTDIISPDKTEQLTTDKGLSHDRFFAWIGLVTSTLNQAVTDAPEDGKQYIRADGGWVEATGTTVLKAKGISTASVANTEADITWDTPQINTTNITVSSEKITIVTTGVYIFDVSLQTQSNHRTELIINTYVDSVQDTDETASNYAARDTDQDTGGVTLSTALSLTAGEVVKFTGYGDCDGTCVMLTAGTILRIQKV